nr:hypothetical protein BgiMline_010125 [Biomphalaria glabrata]
MKVYTLCFVIVFLAVCVVFTQGKPYETFLKRQMCTNDCISPCLAMLCAPATRCETDCTTCTGYCRLIINS